MSLLERFKDFIKANKLLPADEPTLLAVSGGVDSVVMMHLFKAAGFPFGVAHCNFQLRGEASNQDEIFVRELATPDFPFFVKHFETNTYAQQNGFSIQMAARALRYTWFHELAQEQGYARIATAHHLNDSVETALLNFVRGTGLSGLGGISLTPGPSPKERGVSVESVIRTPLSFGEGPGVRLVRPLLFATRDDIESYAHIHGLAWREDSSNASDDYARNFVRHRVIPLLEEMNPNFLHTAGRNLARLRETNENLHFLLRHYFAEQLSESLFQIDKHKLAQLPAPRRALRELLKGHGFTEEQARQVSEGLDHIGLELHSNAGWRLLNDREKIFVVPSDAHTSDNGVRRIAYDDLMVSLPDGGRLMLMHTDVAPSFPDGRESVLMDAEKLCFPLLLRPWRPGDAFQPFGMHGNSQKLQDFFTNLKISRLDKEKAHVLENGDGSILWVVGHRLDERFKVTPKTNKFLKISLIMPSAIA